MAPCATVWKETRVAGVPAHPCGLVSPTAGRPDGHSPEPGDRHGQEGAHPSVWPQGEKFLLSRP